MTSRNNRKRKNRSGNGNNGRAAKRARTHRNDSPTDLWLQISESRHGPRNFRPGNRRRGGNFIRLSTDSVGNVTLARDEVINSVQQVVGANRSVSLTNRSLNPATNLVVSEGMSVRLFLRSVGATG